MSGWIGVDFDGTLAVYDHWQGDEHTGEPVPKMVEKVKQWIRDGFTVKIFTARAANGPAAIKVIEDWCQEHIGQRLEVTNVKDFGMIVLYDDRCVHVERNTGWILG